jgi:UPF0716 protein FxsA
VFRYLLILMIAAPFIELWLLLQINESIGLPKTLMLVVGTGILGATLTKRQGINTLRKMQQQSAQGQMPAAMMVEGMMIFAAGLLLITPGVITDGVGFLLLVPLVRAGLRERLARSIKFQSMGPGMGPGMGPQPMNPETPTSQAAPNSPDDVIDVDFEVHENP